MKLVICQGLFDVGMRVVKRVWESCKTTIDILDLSGLNWESLVIRCLVVCIWKSIQMELVSERWIERHSLIIIYTLNLERILSAMGAKKIQHISHQKKKKNSKKNQQKTSQLVKSFICAYSNCLLSGSTPCFFFLIHPCHKTYTLFHTILRSGSSHKIQLRVHHPIPSE